MNATGRYTVQSNEDFEPNSHDTVLKNYLGIKTANKIEVAEKQELERAELELIQIFDENHQFTAKDICNIHYIWLGNIYPFAGLYRNVTLSKGNFLFASPLRIPQLMTELENKYFSKYTPCHFTNINDLSFAIGIIHVELILIHPFRDGNGRTARLLADLMALQAKKPPINYSLFDQIDNSRGFTQYIEAIHEGLNGNYEPIQMLFKKLIEQSII